MHCFVFNTSSRCTRIVSTQLPGILRQIDDCSCVYHTYDNDFFVQNCRKISVRGAFTTLFLADLFCIFAYVPEEQTRTPILERKTASPVSQFSSLLALDQAKTPGPTCVFVLILNHSDISVRTDRPCGSRFVQSIQGHSESLKFTQFVRRRARRV